MNRHQVSIRREIGCINLPSRFDVVSSAEYRIPFVRLLSDVDTRHVTVDCSGVSYIDSMGMGTLIAWGRSCQRSGKTLLLDKCGKQVVRMFRRVGVENLFAFS